MAARDPLKEYLQQRAQEAQGAQQTSGWQHQKRQALLWALANWEKLHTGWVAALAALVSFPMYMPYDDWKKFAALPILTLFMIPFVALAEIPATFVLVAVMEWIKARMAKRSQPER